MFSTRTPPRPTLPNRPTADQRATQEKWTDDDNKVRCYILASISNELQRQHEDLKTAKEMLTHLKELYGEQSRSARFEVSKRLFKAKMHEGQSVHDHCLTMIKDLEELKKLDVKIDKELQVDLILQSLSVSYGQFIVNYYMNKIECTNAELFNMLVTTEGTLKSSKGWVLAVERAFSSKRKSNWKKKPVKKHKTENKPKMEASKNKAVDKGKYFPPQC
ncbi:uncharacterized protein LOC109704754 [Ananas comosus]|uniref:Uncharacterized protein LOC109704754 n=1 Tax=Ananas comosus TaxID=4615 RepID=A0A6P5EHT9_ANACO|nr:uncharacterized protein LOC109704754 [Ananas comosus]